MKQKLIAMISRGQYIFIGKNSCPTPCIPILCYHRFLPHYQEENSGILSTLPDVFESHMQMLSKHRFQSLTFHEYCDIAAGHREAPEKSVLLTVDDGYADVSIVAGPIAHKYHMKLNLLILAGETGQRTQLGTGTMSPFVNKSMKAYPDLWNTLSWVELKDLQETGVGIGLHGYTHTPLTLLGRNELLRDLEKSLALFREHLGFRSTVFGLPYGDPGSYSIQTLQLLFFLGFTVIFNTNPGRTRTPLTTLPVSRFVIEPHHYSEHVKHMVYGAYDWVGRGKSLWSSLCGSPLPSIAMAESDNLFP